LNNINKNQNNKTKIIKNKKIPKLNDYELNNLSYNEALNYDKRTACDYYCALIKNKQLFMFTFCSFNDYNSGIIKKFIFFLSFALHYTINALFFNDSNMHQIYKDGGSFNFSYQYPYILISALASTLILRLILETLVLTERSIVKIKKQTTYESAIEMKGTLMRNFNIKFAIFFVVNFVLLVAFWYYLTCFNAIYNNTQVYLIENTFISFAISLFFPVFYNIIPTCLRRCALSSENKDANCLYSISRFLQLI
jgi:NADH:ubiquinone oxidoreductase subunit 3 (subunit A)